MMLLNAWKRLIAWTKANAENGTPMPEKAARMARMAFLTSRINAWLSIPLLFLMGARKPLPNVWKVRRAARSTTFGQSGWVTRDEPRFLLCG